MKSFTPFRWLYRMFNGASRTLLGGSRELTVADERYDSPSKLAVRRFFRKPLATGAVIILAGMFLFVFIGSAIAPADLTETGSEMLHTNMAPTQSLMKLPEGMKDGVVDISSRGTFTIGVDTEGKVSMWGQYVNISGDPARDVMNIPEEVKNSKIAHVAAGSDHCVAISQDGHVYAWGEYDNGQYGLEGSMIASARKEPDELLNGTIDASQVRQLICGNQVTAILMEDGTIYAWGNDGLSATNLSSVIKHGKNESKIVKLAFTNDGIYGIDENGSFVCGKSTKYNIISVPDESGRAVSTDLFEYIKDRKVVDIAASGNALALVLDDGEIVVSGMKEPLPELPEGENAVTVSGGTRHFVLTTDQGRVYAWGQNYRNQCNIPAKLTEAGAVDTVYASGFQNYAFKDGKFVDSWGLKGYLMGTDDMGRDVFNRIMNGGRMTMTVGAVAVIVSTIIGIIIGCISGYFGGAVDMLLMRLTEIVGAIPFLPFALCLSAIFQGSDIHEDTRIVIIMLILGVLSWTGLARLVRGQILAEREKEFVTAARSMGVREKRIAFRHILPNIVSVILVTVTLDFASCMLTESSLSYLGFGVQLPRPTWGNMLDGSRSALVIQSFWWRWVFPALFLSIVVICINIIGDTLRDVLDPKSEVEK
ncbi:ABC transporter permease subunit [Acetatifactor aquisgranensis]|uniref:ABC transporter permease subunit n=1 Tax=Acetatifactor aquisgranensis TaxID=2941233 RepID=UPI00203E798B|nr:ABC transporter permease subunit [Acetatifactor aquisgranensis]